MLGRSREEPAAAIFFDEGLKIELGNEAEQGQSEAILTTGFAMAAAAVAAELCKDRHDVIGEIDGQVFVHRLGLQRDCHRLIAERSDELGTPVGERKNAAGGVDLSQGRIGNLVSDISRKVLQASGEV